MSPKEYIKARENKIERSIIDGQPYLPFLGIDTNADDQATKIESAKRIVIEILFGGGGGGNSDGNKADDSSTDKLNVKQIQGGITNELYCCSGLHDELKNLTLDVLHSGFNARVERP